MTDEGSARSGRGRRVGGRVLNALPTLTAGVLFLAVWELFVPITGVKPYLLPPAHSVVVEAVTDAADRFLPASWITFQEVIIGFVIGCGAGILLGIVLSFSKPVERAVMPVIAGVRAMPALVVAPLFVIWYGFTLTPKVLVAAFVCFFPALVNTSTGLSITPEAELQLFRSLGAGRFQMYTKLRLPAALPYIFIGAKNAVVLSVIGALVGEWVGGGGGIGRMMIDSVSSNRTERLMAAVIYSAAMAIGLFLVVSAVERISLRWYFLSRGTRSGANAALRG